MNHDAEPSGDSNGADDGGDEPQRVDHADAATYLASITADADRIAAAWEVGPPSAPVTACPGWTLRDLLVHTGAVHRWATHAIVHASPPDGGLSSAPDDGAELGVWLREGANALVDALDDLDPDGETWHPFPIERRGWVWARRQAIETMLHRFDAETAVGSTSTLRPDLAVVGVHECLEVGYPRATTRDGLSYPGASLHIHCTDDELPAGWGEWLLRVVGGDYVLTTEHAKGDAALRGRAEDVLLVLMGRRDRDVLDVVGDDAAAAAWLELPAW
ncbi:MAG: maleylpyruvate isomerase family mycothiol-dependent enzyme [Actinomycetota bacterium]